MDISTQLKKSVGYSISFVLGALIVLGLSINKNKSIQNQLNVEKLKYDSVLSTKILLTKEIIELTESLKTIKDSSRIFEEMLKLNFPIIKK